MWVSKEILDVIWKVEFFYLNKTATNIYNNRFRKKNQPRIFGGWCWHHKGKEGGPFRSISAARVDAYHSIKNITPPKLHSHGVNAETVLQSKRKNKIVVLNPNGRKIKNV